MTPIELLAPAKNLELGKLAISCGADAVYIGAPRFGARKNAANSLADIARLTEFAHLYSARVYVALNTLLTDSEIRDAQALIHELSQINIDALIIQDLGLLTCDLASIPVFASTQTHNIAVEKIRFLEHIGFSRVILGRELSLDEIAAIRAQTTVELETFIHGALCVGFSGQCHLSACQGPRSGNRGDCAQPCRKKYRLRNRDHQPISDFRHWLSLKDFNASANLGKLLEAGISSFKIEGRLKDADYIKNIVSYYRQTLDAQLALRRLKRSSEGQSEINFIPDPHKSFNRDFTAYFLSGKPDSIARTATPKMTGELIGTVSKLDQRTGQVTITPASRDTDPGISLHAGDGICYFNTKQELTGTNINSVNGSVIILNNSHGLGLGSTLFRNHDHVWHKQLAGARIARRIPVNLLLTAEAADTLALTLTDNQGKQATVTLEYHLTPATDPAITWDRIREQLGKLGNTPLTARAIEITLPQVAIIPIKIINELRRQASDAFIQMRINEYVPIRIPLNLQTPPYPDSDTPVYLNRTTQVFYQKCGTNPSPAIELANNQHSRVFTSRYCLLFETGHCLKNPSDRPLTNAVPAYLEDENQRTFAIRPDCTSCVMNLTLDHPENT